MDLYSPVLREFLQLVFELWFKRIEEELQFFAEALDAWLHELFRHPMPDWRECFEQFLTKQEAEGRMVAPESHQDLLAYLERWSATVDWSAVEGGTNGDDETRMAVTAPEIEAGRPTVSNNWPALTPAETESAVRFTASEHSQGQVQSDADEATRATSDARYNRKQQPAAPIDGGNNQDPIAVDASDANLDRHVGNQPTRYINPDGLQFEGTFTAKLATLTGEGIAESDMKISWFPPAAWLAKGSHPCHVGLFQIARTTTTWRDSGTITTNSAPHYDPVEDGASASDWVFGAGYGADAQNQRTKDGAQAKYFDTPGIPAVDPWTLFGGWDQLEHLAQSFETGAIILDKGSPRY